MGAERGMYGAEEKYIQGWKGGKNHSDDRSIDGRIILKWISKK
jgi:hypothetical protein